MQKRFVRLLGWVLECASSVMRGARVWFLKTEVEATALAKEADIPSRERLSAVRGEKAKLEEMLRPLRLQYEREKETIDELRALARKEDELKAKIARAERAGDMDLVAELRFDALPGLQKRLQSLRKQQADYEQTHKPLLTEVRAQTQPGGCKAAKERARETTQEGGVRLFSLLQVVGPAAIADVVHRWTGIPVSKLTQRESERLLRLADRLAARVVGQRPAIDAIANAILRAAAGLARRNKPIGSFLFLGPVRPAFLPSRGEAEATSREMSGAPRCEERKGAESLCVDACMQTGVGKTELCKAVAEELFDSAERIVRLDMSEFMESHSVSKLIGAPPGYVGHDEGGQLTEEVRRNPYSIVLLDEVEKAHPQVRGNSSRLSAFAALASKPRLRRRFLHFVLAPRRARASLALSAFAFAGVERASSSSGRRAADGLAGQNRRL